jgi:inositol-1,3,4-trisphosphate 5/6-kinase/inositol-tetrakisphosphate 1-kinase
VIWEEDNIEYFSIPLAVDEARGTSTPILRKKTSNESQNCVYGRITIVNENCLPNLSVRSLGKKVRRWTKFSGFGLLFVFLVVWPIESEIVPSCVPLFASSFFPSLLRHSFRCFCFFFFFFFFHFTNIHQQKRNQESNIFLFLPLSLLSFSLLYFLSFLIYKMVLGELNDIIGEEMRKRHWRPIAAQKARAAKQLLLQQQQEQGKGALTIGHYDYDTKRLGFVLEHFKKQGHIVVPFDLSKPIEEQGRFDVLIQKATKLIAKRGEDSEAKQKIEFLEQYKRKNPVCVITDSAEAVEFTTDRVLLDKALETLDVTDGVGRVLYPRSVILDMTKTSASTERETLLRDFTFPAVAKPMNADGSPESHDMALVYNSKGLADLKLGDKIVLQEFVNHDAVLHKVYVIGDKVFVGVRPSLPNIDLSTKKLDYEYFGRISSAEDDSCQANSAPSQVLVEKACQELRKRLGLSLFGVDIITKTDSNEHFVIDVNYFPTYAGVPNVAENFSSFIESAILDAKKAARAG